jgi:glycosidase
MQWDESPSAGFSAGKPYAELVHGERDYHHVNVARQLADPGSLLRSVQHMIAVRKENPVLGRGRFNWLETDNPSVAAFLRQDSDRSLLILSNLSSSRETVKLATVYHGRYLDLLGRTEFAVGETTALQPYASVWLQGQR